MTELIYSHFRTGKTFMQEMKWKNLKCEDCNEELIIDSSNEYEEIKICPECGKKHLLIKKIRKDVSE